MSFTFAKKNRYDIIYASSSRLMTAVLGAFLAWHRQAALYLDIRDIFVDTIGDVLPHILAQILIPFFGLLEKFAISRAEKINLVSVGFRSYFEKRFPQKSYTYFPNGIDPEFVGVDRGGGEAQPKSDILNVVYAGNFGEGQGLETIIPPLAKHFEGRIDFILIGDGAKKQRLEKAIEEVNVSNVALVPPIARQELINFYKKADVLFLHLNQHSAFEKVLPSKIFEYAALGKPIWAGVAGHAAQFFKEHIDNAVIFEPCNSSQAIDVFDQLEMKTEPRAEFVAEFSRREIVNKMANDIIKIKEHR